MDTLTAVRIAAIVVSALLYMLFDIFNNRNVPSLFAYGTLVLGLVLTLLYGDIGVITESLLIAVAVGALGYIIYRIGQIGAADVIEFAAISLMMPIMPNNNSLFGVHPQFGIPLIISVFMASGVFALAMIPFYYIPRAKMVLKRDLSSFIDQKDKFKGFAIFVAYMAFAAFAQLEIGLSPIGWALVLTLAISSVETTVFERPLIDSMVQRIPVSMFEEGDIVATNMMSSGEISRVRRHVREFDRLMTGKLIAQMKKAKIKEKFPVYRNAMPLALPIFLGTVVSLLFGNIMLAVLSSPLI